MTIQKTSRRSFLAGVAATTAMATAAASPMPPAIGVVEGEAYWESVRRRFSFREE